jgi:hypothetical protein
MLVLLSFGLSAQISLPFECGTIEDESGTPNELPVNCAPFSNYANGFEARHGDKLIPSGATIKTILKTNIIIMQDDNGEGNFKYSNNAIHKAFLDEIYERVNQRMVALSPDCTPAGSPNGYTSGPASKFRCPKLDLLPAGVTKNNFRSYGYASDFSFSQRPKYLRF